MVVYLQHVKDSALMRYNVVYLFSLQSYVFCPLMILSLLNVFFSVFTSEKYKSESGKITADITHREINCCFHKVIM